MKTPHLVLSIPRSLTLYILSGCESLLQEEISLMEAERSTGFLHCNPSPLEAEASGSLHLRLV